MAIVQNYVHFTQLNVVIFEILVKRKGVFEFRGFLTTAHGSNT